MKKFLFLAIGGFALAVLFLYASRPRRKKTAGQKIAEAKRAGTVGAVSAAQMAERWARRRGHVPVVKDKPAVQPPPPRVPEEAEVLCPGGVCPLARELERRKKRRGGR